MLAVTSLPWEDVICKNIFTYLPLQTICRLRRVSKTFDALVALYVSKFCRHLDLSEIGSRKKFSADVFVRISRTSNCSLLSLNLEGCRSWLRDDVVLPVIASNPDIRFLNVTDCSNLSATFFCSVAERQVNLQRLDFSYCRQLPSDALTVIGQNCRTLQSVDVSGCWNVDDTPVVAIALGNPLLKELRTMSCYAVTDRAIFAVAKNCRNLVTLDIRGCWRVKDAAIKLLSEYCRHLQQLLVKDCSYITEVSLARFRPRGVVIDKEIPRYLLQGNRHLVPFLQV